MRGMNKSIFLAGLAQAAAYIAGSKNHITEDFAIQIIAGAERQTTKQMARARTRDGKTIYVPSAKWVDRSIYWPHQGPQEMARRVRQMRKAAG